MYPRAPPRCLNLCVPIPHGLPTLPGVTSHRPSSPGHAPTCAISLPKYSSWLRANSSTVRMVDVSSTGVAPVLRGDTSGVHVEHDTVRSLNCKCEVPYRAQSLPRSRGEGAAEGLRGRAETVPARRDTTHAARFLLLAPHGLVTLNLWAKVLVPGAPTPSQRLLGLGKYPPFFCFCLSTHFLFTCRHQRFRFRASLTPHTVPRVLRVPHPWCFLPPPSHSP